MKKYGQLLKELPSRRLVIVALGFQPITKEHEKLLAIADKIAAAQSAPLVCIVLSQKLIQPIGFLSKLFPKIPFFEVTSSIQSQINFIVQSGRYSDVTIVTSAQKEKDFAKLKISASVNIIKGTAIDPDSSTETKKVIDSAKKGDYETFRKMAPSLMIELEIKRMFNAIRQSFGIETIKEQVKFEVPEIREKYFNGEIFKLDETVECASSGEVYKIVKRGSNHLLVQTESGSLISKWLQDVIQSNKHFELQEGKEMKYNQSDKIKVARVIASSLGVQDTEKSTNPELLINTALRKIKSKPLKPEYVGILHNMLATAKEAGIAYDEKLVPQKVDEQNLPKKPDNTPETDPSVTDITGPEFTKVGHSLEYDKDHLRKMKVKYKLGEEKEEENEKEDEKEDDDMEDMDDSDIEKMLDGLKDDDYLEAYDDDELHLVDAETGEHISSLKEETQTIMEVLSRAERIRAKIRFARSEAKRERRTQIALKTRSNSQTINKRARRLAIQVMKQRLARKPLEKLTIGEKERIEKIIERRKAIIGRIAMKLVPRIRKIETDRLSHKSFTK